jgi:hypothetical protein
VLVEVPGDNITIFSSRQTVYKYLRLNNIPLRPEDIAPWRWTRFGEMRKGNLIAPEPKGQKVIKLVKALRQKGHSYQKIADILNSKGVKTHLRFSTWYPKTVRSAEKSKGARAES